MNSIILTILLVIVLRALALIVFLTAMQDGFGLHIVSAGWLIWGCLGAAALNAVARFLWTGTDEYLGSCAGMGSDGR